MNIGIVGSRRRNKNADFVKVFHAFEAQRDKLKKMLLSQVTIISGGCPEGADYFAEFIAKHGHVPIIIHYPDKKKMKRLIKEGLHPKLAATKVNYARNKKIAKDSTRLIACVARDRKGGTENTIKYFCGKYEKTESELVKEGTLILV